MSTQSDYGTREGLIEAICTCKTQKQALLLAARLVLMHREKTMRIATLERKFGDALCEVIEKG